MTLSSANGRPTRIRVRIAGALLVTGAAQLLTAAVASAEPAPRPPNCMAADMAGIASGVAAATSAYLFTHPEVNTFFTDLHGRPHDEVPDATRVYFDSHPQEYADLRGMRQPLVDFRERCGLTAPSDSPIGQ